MLKTESKLRSASKISPIRRHIQHLNFVNGVHFFACKSMSRIGLPTSHFQEIDTDDGRVRCNCEHHRFKHAHREPTLGQPELLCKHLIKAADWLERHNQMPDVSTLVAHRCIHCGIPDAPHELCDDSGRATGGHYCADCLRIARMMSSGSTPREPETERMEEEFAPDYEPETVPGYEPEYSEPAGGEDFDARR